MKIFCLRIKSKLIPLFFLFILQISIVYAIVDMGSINVDVKSIPSLKLELNGPFVIRNGDTAFIKLKIFNDNSNDSIILNSFDILNEENKVVVSQKPHFTFEGINEKIRKNC